MMGCNLLLLSIQTIAMSPLSPNYKSIIVTRVLRSIQYGSNQKKQLLTNKKIVMDVQIINYENFKGGNCYVLNERGFRNYKSTIF